MSLKVHTKHLKKKLSLWAKEHRRELWKAINKKPTRIIVENKDRLTRFGFNYIERLLKA